LCDFAPPLLLFFLVILYHIFIPLSPLLMMILNKTQLAKDGVQNRSEIEGVRNRTISKI